MHGTARKQSLLRPPRSRNGAPSRKGCVVKGQMTKASNKPVLPPPSFLALWYQLLASSETSNVCQVRYTVRHAKITLPPARRCVIFELVLWTTGGKSVKQTPRHALTRCFQCCCRFGCVCPFLFLEKTGSENSLENSFPSWVCRLPAYGIYPHTHLASFFKEVRLKSGS